MGSDGVAEQVGQHGALQVEQTLGHAVVGGHTQFLAVQVVGRKAALQGRRDAKAIGTEHRLGNQIQCLALHLCRHRLQRVAARTGEVAQRAQATNVAHQHTHGAEGVAQRVRQRTAQHGVVFVAGQHARFLALKKVACDGQTLGGKSDGVGAQVPLNGFWVQAKSVVFVAAVGQQGLVAARGNALQFGICIGRRDVGRKGAVGVLDGPVVVRPQRGLKGHARACAGRRQVDGAVLHDRATGAIGLGEFGVGQLLFGVDPRRAKVVAQPQGVANFVHHGVFQIRQHKLLRGHVTG